MAPKWYEYAKKYTSQEEHLEKYFDGTLDGDYGHLLISDKKLIFVKEEGLFRKKYSAPLILPYELINDVHPIDEYHILISEKTGKSHKFAESNVTNVNIAIHEKINWV